MQCKRQAIRINQTFLSFVSFPMLGVGGGNRWVVGVQYRVCHICSTCRSSRHWSSRVRSGPSCRSCSKSSRAWASCDGVGDRRAREEHCDVSRAGHARARPADALRGIRSRADLSPLSKPSRNARTPARARHTGRVYRLIETKERRNQHKWRVAGGGRRAGRVSVPQSHSRRLVSCACREWGRTFRTAPAGRECGLSKRCGPHKCGCRACRTDSALQSREECR
jgi:hypothetical protein